ncbi:hypothetical protein [Burkholderia gladioli]|uniref:hypothetical protein n=1 Tax=Burkholderia gladioli TaxID=28095 RepID=UPI0034DB5EBA
MATVDPFAHLERRCRDLIERYLEPIIDAEKHALETERPLPEPDFDSLAAFRLLSHAELEGYFEAKATAAIADLDGDFSRNAVVTNKFAALIFLYLWKQKRQPEWSSTGNDDAETVDFKKLAQEALGYGRQFVADNNGIKENSINTLSALMGYFGDQLDEVLVNELNQYGKKRGDVAHNSWVHNTRTFESAEIEKNRLENILYLTKEFYEKSPEGSASRKRRGFLESIVARVRRVRRFRLA